MKMFNRFYRLLPLMLLAALCWSCQKEVQPSSFRITMAGWGDANGQKVYLDDVSPKFELNDKIRINGATYIVEEIDANDHTDSKTWWTLTYLSGPESDWAPFKAGFPASALKSVTDLNTATDNITVTLPQKQYYRTTADGKQKLNAPMFATSEDNHLVFHNACSVMKVEITNNTDDVRYIDSIDVIAHNAQLSGTMKVRVTDIDNGEPAVVGAETVSDDNKWVRLYGIGGAGGKRVDVGATAHFYIYLPTYTNSKLTVKVYENSHGSKYKCTVSQAESTSAGTLPRNRIFAVPYPLTTELEEKDGFTPVTGGGGFTVQMAGGQPSQKVYLGYGNLYHNNDKIGVAYEEWYVAPYQYIMDADTTAAGLKDIFYYSQGTGNNYGVKSSSSYTQANFKDWGNTINATTGHWRTLTGKEWATLIGYDKDGAAPARPNAANLWGYAQITEIPSSLSPSPTRTGIMLFPDDWVMPASLASSHPFTPATATASNNSYTHEEWLLLEEAGAIFLPYYPLYGNRVSYWASGYDSSPTTAPLYSYCFHTAELGGVHDHGTDPMFVRLAVNVEYVDAVPPIDE